MKLRAVIERITYQNGENGYCRSGILYTLNQLANEGHVYAHRDQLVEAGVKLLETDKASIKSALDQMIAAEDLKTEDEAIYMPPFYFSEEGTANKLKTLLATRQQKMFEKEPDIATGWLAGQAARDFTPPRSAVPSAASILRMVQSSRQPSIFASPTSIWQRSRKKRPGTLTSPRSTPSRMPVKRKSCSTATLPE